MNNLLIKQAREKLEFFEGIVNYKTRIDKKERSKKLQRLIKSPVFSEAEECSIYSRCVRYDRQIELKRY